MHNLQSQNQSSKGLIILKIIIVVSVLVLISGAAYGTWKIFSKPKPPSGTEEPTIELTISEPTIQPEPDQTAHWKVYRNKNYNFVIKYPKDWEVSCQVFRLGECIELFHSANYKTALAGEVRKRQEVILGANVTLGISQISPGMTWLEWTQRARGASGKLISSEQINLNNLSWEMVFINEGLQPPRKYISIAFPGPGQKKVYEFILSIVADENEQEYRNIFNQTLLTFEFTN